MTLLSGWGRTPVVETDVVHLRAPTDAGPAIRAARGAVARGAGRAYGDAGVGARQTLMARGLDRFKAFDPQSALLAVEAGVLLDDVITAFLPRGFFPAVVPGTRFVTIGGAIASDVHGKNHHRDGGFGDHVESFVIATANGETLRASRTERPELFSATIGGMGLTGVITEATLRLRRVETGWIKQKTVAAPNLEAAMAALDAADDATYSVAWIDCVARGAHLGRSLIYLGEHATRDDMSAVADDPFPKAGAARLAVPMDFPGFSLNRLTVGAFNEIYFRRGAGAATNRLVGVYPYFFPLDGVGAWNRIYGRGGFLQHQCVLPLSTAPAALAEIVGRIAKKGGASFLAVLKKFGDASGVGLLSFPLRGYTLALDFPMTLDLPAFLDELDGLVVAAGGRIYLAKDARQSRATFEAGYPTLGAFCDFRKSIDPAGHVQSHLGQRLGL